MLPLAMIDIISIHVDIFFEANIMIQNHFFKDRDSVNTVTIVRLTTVVKLRLKKSATLQHGALQYECILLFYCATHVHVRRGLQSHPEISCM